MPYVASLNDGHREVAILKCDNAAKGKWLLHDQEEPILGEATPDEEETDPTDKMLKVGLTLKFKLVYLLQKIGASWFCNLKTYNSFLQTTFDTIRNKTVWQIKHFVAWIISEHGVGLEGGYSLNKKIKTDFPGKSTFFELPITQKRFIFEESYISNGKRQKELYFNLLFKSFYRIWRFRVFNSSSKSTGYFICRWGST